MVNLRMLEAAGESELKARINYKLQTMNYLCTYACALGHNHIYLCYYCTPLYISASWNCSLVHLGLRLRVEEQAETVALCVYLESRLRAQSYLSLSIYKYLKSSIFNLSTN
jgi:hypothetical protein